MELPPKVKNRTTLRPSNSTVQYLSEENENTTCVYVGRNFIAVLAIILIGGEKNKLMRK